MEFHVACLLLVATLASLASSVRQRMMVERESPTADAEGNEREEWKCLTDPGGECPVIPPQATWSSDSVELVEEHATSNPIFGDFTWKLYRNLAYTCGLSGHYTFVVLENRALVAEGAEAPLWVFEHGGGVGYWDGEDYHGAFGQTQEHYNREESAGDLIEKELVYSALDASDQPRNTTVFKRWQEGYRLLAVSYCDHDGYTGGGTPYLSNPQTSAERNGLQASWAAVDYTLRNYNTSKYFLHGCSAGSIGVYFLALAMSYAEYEPLPSGSISDSFAFTTRQIEFFVRANRPSGQWAMHEDFDVFAWLDTASPYVKMFEANTAPENVMRSGFKLVPMLFIYGEKDPFCGFSLDLIPGAAAANVSNCKWLYSIMEQAAEGTNGTHVVKGVHDGLHVPTIFAATKTFNEEAITAVDDFIHSK